MVLLMFMEGGIVPEYRLIDPDTRKVLHPGPFSTVTEALIKSGGHKTLYKAVWEEIPKEEENDNSKN